MQQQRAPKQSDADRERAEYEEFRRWKQMNESEGTGRAPKRTEAPSSATPATRKDSAPDARLANSERPRRRREAAPAASPAHSERAEELPEEHSGEWSIDPKTGVRYIALPSTPKEAIAAYKKTKGAGLSKREMMAFIETQDNFDIDDLNGTAQTFMGHLRVPPSKEEQEELIRKKKELVREQKAEREVLDQEINEKEGAMEEPEANPFEQQGAKRGGLFGRKSRKKTGA